MGKITESLAHYGREHGVDIITNAEIAEIRVSENKVSSVNTTDGRKFTAPVIASNLSAKAMYLNLIDEKHLPDEVLREIRGYRTMSTAFKMNVACERPPQYSMLSKLRKDGVLGDFDYPTYMHIAPDIDYLERAYDDAKHGWYSKEPFITPVCPTIVDDTLAPPRQTCCKFLWWSCSLHIEKWRLER